MRRLFPELDPGQGQAFLKERLLSRGRADSQSATLLSRPGPCVLTHARSDMALSHVERKQGLWRTCLPLCAEWGVRTGVPAWVPCFSLGELCLWLFCPLWVKRGKRLLYQPYSLTITHHGVCLKLEMRLLGRAGLVLG